MWPMELGRIACCPTVSGHLFKVNPRSPEYSPSNVKPKMVAVVWLEWCSFMMAVLPTIMPGTIALIDIEVIQ